MNFEIKMDPNMSPTILLSNNELLKYLKHITIAATCCCIYRKTFVFMFKKLFIFLFRNSKSWDNMNVTKSAEEAVKTIFFGYSFSTGLNLMMSDGVFNDEYELYSNGSISESQYYMYVLYMSWYFHKVFLDPFEYHRRDWIQMNLHHVVTCALIFMSYAFNFHKVGVLVMFLNDPADISLALAKGFKGLDMSSVGTFFFASTVFIWGYTRVYALLVHVIIPSWIRGPEVALGMETHHTGATISRVLISILWVLNINWWFLMIRISKNKIFSGKSITDYRSGHDKND